MLRDHRKQKGGFEKLGPELSKPPIRVSNIDSARRYDSPHSN